MSDQTPIEFDLDDAMSKARELATQVSPDSLLKAYANLTRRMQRAGTEGQVQQEMDLRTQRGILETELLRRMAPLTISDVQLNRAAQAAYDTKLVHIPAMTDKPRVVSMVYDILRAVGIPVAALPDDQD